MSAGGSLTTKKNGMLSTWRVIASSRPCLGPNVRTNCTRRSKFRRRAREYLWVLFPDFGPKSSACKDRYCEYSAKYVHALPTIIGTEALAGAANRPDRVEATFAGTIHHVIRHSEACAGRVKGAIAASKASELLTRRSAPGKMSTER